jgi:ankyrin repeat protein
MQKIFSGIATIAKNQVEKELFDAAKKGELSKLTTLLKMKSTSANKVNGDGDTLLHIAVMHNHIQIVKYLIDNYDVDVNVRNHAGKTPLMIAKEKSFSNIANYLLSKNPENKSNDPVKMHVLYDFIAEQSTELSLHRGDIVTVITQESKEWSYVEFNGQQGYVPTNYLSAVLSSQAVATDMTLPQVESKFSRMMRQIKENDKTLAHFSSGDVNGIAGMGDKELFALAEALKTNTQTTNLYLILSTVSEKSISKIAEVLSKSTTITNLTIHSSYNCHSLHFAVALKTNKHLKSFSLRSTQLSEAETIAFAKALEENMTLNSFSLYQTVSDAGAVAIANMLRKNKGLLQIFLEGNQIGDIGAAELAKSVVENKILNEMSLGVNKITDTGGVAFVKAMLINRSIRISLSGNKIGKSVKEQIENIEYQNKTLTEQLHTAIQTGDLDVVKAKIAAGISPFGNRGYSILSQAVQRKKPEIVHFLLTEMIKYHPDPLSRERITRHTLLEYAELIRDVEMVKVLKEFSPNTDEKIPAAHDDRSSSSKKMPLDLERSLTRIQSYGTEDQKQKIVHTHLVQAVMQGNLSSVQWHISSGTKINDVIDDYYGDAFLAVASKWGQLEVVEYLVSEGADVNQQNKTGQTPLLLAAHMGAYSTMAANIKITGKVQHLEVVKYLESKGANIDHPDINDDTPLIWAAKMGQLEIVKYLVSRGAKINHQNLLGNTPLIAALPYSGKFGPDKLELVEYLLSQGADIWIKNKDGKTVLDIADRTGACKPILPKLREMAAKNQPNSGDDSLVTQPSIELQLPAKPVRQLPVKPQQYPLNPITSLNPPKKPLPKVIAKLPSISSVGKAPPVVIDPIAGLGKMEVSFSIPYTALKIDKELGRGGCGIVYKGTYNHIEVAIKQLHLDRLSEAAEAEFQNEVKVMAELRSPNIVLLYGVCIDTRPFSIVMEYLPKGSLYKVLQSQQALDWDQRLKIAIDIACGLAFLHASKFLHRDLKSLNILLDDNLRAKLTDFGLTNVRTESKMNSSQRNPELVGTPAWIAPEIFSVSPKYSVKSDMYAYGITLWEIAARRRPYAQVTDFAVLKECVKQGEREEIPPDCPDRFSETIEVCWRGNPAERPDAEEALAYLKGETETLLRPKR